MSLRDEITSTKEGMFAWQQERSIFEITNLLCDLMDQEGVSRTELAVRLGKTKGYITQLLDGSTNMTVRTISDVFTALGFEFHPSASRMGLQDQFRMEFESIGQYDLSSADVASNSEPWSTTAAVSRLVA